MAEQPDDSVWLALEHVQEPPGVTWPLERHVLAARHFGQFNGAHYGEWPVSDFPWLSREFVRQWVRTAHAFGLVDTASDLAFWEHPLGRLAFPIPSPGASSICWVMRTGCWPSSNGSRIACPTLLDLADDARKLADQI